MLIGPSGNQEAVILRLLHLKQRAGQMMAGFLVHLGNDQLVLIIFVLDYQVDAGGGGFFGNRKFRRICKFFGGAGTVTEEIGRGQSDAFIEIPRTLVCLNHAVRCPCLRQRIEFNCAVTEVGVGMGFKIRPEAVISLFLQGDGNVVPLFFCQFMVSRKAQGDVHSRLIVIQTDLHRITVVIGPDAAGVIIRIICNHETVQRIVFPISGWCGNHFQEVSRILFNCDPIGFLIQRNIRITVFISRKMNRISRVCAFLIGNRPLVFIQQRKYRIRQPFLHVRISVDEQF